MSATYRLKCLKCGEEEELWFPSFEAADAGLAAWRCKDCGCPKYEKRPQVSFWSFGPKLKERG